jgi:two-component system sensor histidine kinase UhpB
MGTVVFVCLALLTSPALSDVILLRQPPFVASYRPYVIAGVAISAAQFALIVGLLLQRAQLRRARADSKRELTLNRELAGRLISSQEEERSRIARDLHDDVSQEIAAIGVDLSYVRQHVPCPDARDRLLSLGQRIAAVAESLRLLSHGLHPSVLNQIGLVGALQAHCSEIERKHHLHVRLSADEALEPRSPLVALSLFRIGQEAMQNTVKHGHAREASVSLARDDDHLTFSISDDGAGFDLAAARHNGGLGLVSLEERARLIHGELTIRSAPGCGTSIDVTVPAAVIDQDQEGSDRCVVRPYCSPTIMPRSRMASSES